MTPRRKMREGLTSIAVLTLGLGAALAVATAVHAVLGGAVPFPEPDRLVHLRESTPESPRRWVAWANYLDWRERTVATADENRPFEQMAAHGLFGAVLTANQPLQREVAARVTAELFPMLGARPALGRLFGPEDDRPGAAAVVVLSHDFWRSHFGGWPGVIGQILEIEGKGHEIVGVMEPDFLYPRTLRQLDLYLPLGAISADWGRSNEDHPGLSVTARLRSGVSQEQAHQHLDAVAADLARQYPETNREQGVQLQSLRREIVGHLEESLRVLAVAAAMVLILASASFSHLLLARFAVRRVELQTRMALGASPWRLTLWEWVDALRLALVSAALAVPLAGGLLSGAGRLIRLENQPAFGELVLGAETLALLAALAVLVAIISGAPAAWMAWRLATTSNPTDLTSSRTATRGRTLRVLVATQLALALALAIGATLISRSYVAILATEPGFESRSIASFRVLLPETELMPEAVRAEFYRQVAERIRGLNGVEEATVATPLLRGWSTSFEVEGGDGEKEVAESMRVDGRYFTTLGLSVIRGKRFEVDGFLEDEIVVCERFAKRYWPEAPALGARLRLGSDPDDARWRRVVSVVSHVKNRGVHRESRPQLYLPLGDSPPGWANVAFRTDQSVDLAITARKASEMVNALRPDVLAAEVQILAERVEADRQGPRLLTACLIFFAAATLLIAVLGAYDLVTTSVAQRRRELGVHGALGARPADLRRLVLGEAVSLAALGGAAGLSLAALGTVWLSRQLFGVHAFDPWPWILWPLLLVGAVACAAWPGAHRAAAADLSLSLKG